MNKTRIEIEYVWIDGQETQSLRSKTRILEVDLRKYSDIESYIGHTPRILSFSDLEKIPFGYFDGSFTNQKYGDEAECILKPVKLYKDANKYIALCEVYNMSNKPVNSNYRWELSHLCDKSPKSSLSVKQEYIIWNDSRSPMNDFYCGTVTYGRYIVDEHLKSCTELEIMIDEIYSTEYKGKWIYGLGNNDILSMADNLWISRFMLHKICNENRDMVFFDSNKVSVYKIPLKLYVHHKDKILIFNAHDNPYKIFLDLL